MGKMPFLKYCHEFGKTLLSELSLYCKVLRFTFIEIKCSSPNHEKTAPDQKDNKSCGHTLGLCFSAFKWNTWGYNFVMGSQAHNKLCCSLWKRVNDLLLIAFLCHVGGLKKSKNVNGIKHVFKACHNVSTPIRKCKVTHMWVAHQWIVQMDSSHEMSYPLQGKHFIAVGPFIP